MGKRNMQQQRRARAAAWPALLILVGAALMASPPTASGGITEGWVPVDTTMLDTMRGGFTTPAGLEVSLGIERVVMLNGILVAHTTVEIADIGKLSGTNAEQTRAALSSLNLVQSGADNMAASLTDAVPAATLVQNTLDGQRIDSSTVIHSSVNSIGLLTALNVQDNLRDALSRAALPY